MKLKKRVAVTVAVMLAMACPQMAFADDGFTGAKFLTWKTESQLSYIRIAVGMAGVVATQVDTTKAKCIDTWYYGDENKGNSFIINTMKRFPEHHPMAAILAVIEKKCGKF